MARYDDFKHMEKEIVKDVVRNAVRDEMMNTAVRHEVQRGRIMEDVSTNVRRELEDRAVDGMLRRRR
ncbi:hypothetical protein UT300012_21930 [Paraclostridium bifermentans]